MSEYLPTEAVCGKLTAVGVDPQAITKIWGARLEPENLTDPDKKHVMAVPDPDGKVFLLVYRFGTGGPLPVDRAVSMPQETGPDWRPRWLSIEGPFEVVLGPDRKPLPDCEVMVKARELTA